MGPGCAPGTGGIRSAVARKRAGGGQGSPRAALMFIGEGPGADREVLREGEEEVGNEVVRVLDALVASEGDGPSGEELM